MKQPRVTTKRIGWLLAAAAVLLVILFSFIAGWIKEWLWMHQLGYVQIFWKLLSIKFVSAGIAFLIVFAYIGFNLYAAVKETFRLRGEGPPESVVVYTKDGTPISAGLSKLGSFLIAIAIAFFFAYAFYPQWDIYLRYFWGGSFGRVDPIFGKDIGFYLFRLPFYELIQDGLAALTFVTFLLVGFLCIYLGVFTAGRRIASQTNWAVIGHMAILLILFIGSWAWGLYLDRFELLYSRLGVVYGVGYTVDHMTRVGIWIMLIASFALMGLIAACSFTRQFGVLLAGIGSYLVLYFIILTLLPGLVQKYKVQPSELELETPYLKHNIAFTRTAFQLDKIEEKAYPSLRDLTLADIESTATRIRFKTSVCGTGVPSFRPIDRPRNSGCIINFTTSMWTGITWKTVITRSCFPPGNWQLSCPPKPGPG